MPMREIRDILGTVGRMPAGERAVLATVVDLQGSGYRLPGARMLIREGGEAVGTVSGGCLEADVMERARRVMDTGRAEVFVYDTTKEEDSVFSLNMGCRGVMRVLMEAVDAGSEIFRAIRRVGESREREDLALVVGTEGDTAFKVGSRLSGDSPASLAAVPGLEADLRTFALSRGNYQTIKYETGGGKVEFVFEAVRPPVQLHILGAGADAVPLGEAAYALGWRVNVCDHRPAFLNRERFAAADDLVFLNRDAEPEWDVDELTAFVLMNHNYDRDKAMLPGALRSSAFYVGALGPKRRTERMFEELAIDFTEEQLARLRAPAGLDIGADTPEGIAVSIIAEIQSVLRHRGGGPLRDREGSIYDRK